MKWELEDNTQEAIQFLMLGAAIVLAIKALVVGVDLLFDESTASELGQIAAFHRKSFILSGRDVIVVGGMDLFGRLAVAFLLSIAAAVAGGLIGLLIARGAGRPYLPTSVGGARFGLVIVGATALYSALFLPPSTVQISNEGAVFRSRIAIADAISIPFTLDRHEIPWQQVDSVMHRKIDLHDRACGVIDRVELITNGNATTILEEIPEGSDCAGSRSIAQESSLELIELLYTNYLQDRTNKHSR